jgi:hypothetical protein
VPIFQEITLAWKGREKKIPPDRVMVAVAIAEDIVTLGELARMSVGGDVKLARVSQAYAALLRFAGHQVTDEEVYDDLFENKNDMVRRALEAVTTLQMLMVPPERLRQKDAQPKKEEAAAQPPAA